jgi:radical SAM-linked protein
VVETAYELGCRLDGWTEHFVLSKWEEACQKHGLDLAWYLRERTRDEVMPWDHLDSLLSKSFLWSEWNAALQEAYVADCALESPAACYMCGVCDHRVVKNRIYPEVTYRAPEPEPEGFVPEVKLRRRPASAQATRRVRIRFGKHGGRVFLGHLDTADAIIWALRRGDIAVAYSEGYHPKPKLQFTPATPVGVESYCEYVDIVLRDPMDADEVRRRLSRALPEGLPLYEVTSLPEGAATINEMLRAVDYRFEVPAGAEEIGDRVTAYQAAPRLLVKRESQPKNCKNGGRGQGRRGPRGPEGPSVRELDFTHTLESVELLGPRAVRVRLRQDPNGTPRPSEILGHLLAVHDGELQTQCRIIKEQAVLGEMTAAAAAVTTAAPGAAAAPTE